MQTILQIVKLMINSKHWEQRLGAMQVSIYTLGSTEMDKASETISWFKSFLFDKSVELLNDDEFIVRNTIGNIIQTLIYFDGEEVYTKFKPILIQSIIEALSKVDLSKETNSNSSNHFSSNEFIKIFKYLIQNLDIKSSKENEEENSKELTVEEEIEKTKLLIKTIWDMKKETLRDIEGLEPLETSMELLSKMAEFLDVKFLTYDLSEVTQILFKTTSHPNKYVRETSFNIIELLFKIADKWDQESQTKYLEQWHSLISTIAAGLADNWSNVRNAVALAAYTYCTFADSKQEIKERYEEELLAPLWLSRYYIPEGVENIFIEIWKIVVKDQGINILLSHWDIFCKYYISSWYAENQVIRKAAWHWISEIWVKVANTEPEPFRPYISDMIAALIELLNDPNWPVRDSACMAIGKITERYPAKCTIKKDDLLMLSSLCIKDNFTSVRERAAIALFDAFDIFGDDIVNTIKSILKDNLMKAKTDQPTESHKTTEMGGSPSSPSHKKFSIDQMYNFASYGSFGSNLKSEGGPMNYRITRENEPWEYSDGWVYMLRELSRSKKAPLLPNYLESLSELAYIDHFK